MRQCLRAVLGAASLLCVTAAQAQVGNATRPPEAPGPTRPGPQPDENLSDRLKRTDGVLPPARTPDSGMSVPAPDTGTTPVLPPPDRTGPPGTPRAN